MKCPHCNVECNALVLETRKLDGELFRKRVCGHCGRPFVSREYAEVGFKLPSRPGRHKPANMRIEDGPKATSLEAFKAWR
jgi:transcriptional regulator NrdR family protein